MSHSPEFLVVRDAILALEDEDRMRLVSILEAADPAHANAGRLCDLLAAAGRLERTDRRRLAKWVRTYVNRWGQVPVASSRAASAAYEPRRL